MSLPLPDKWVRKAVFEALSDLGYPVYDSHTVSDSPSAYVLMTTQTNNEVVGSKCGRRWSSSILLDIITRYDGSGNTGSRLLADNIAEDTRSRVENLVLDVASGLLIDEQVINFPNDLTTKTDTVSVFRKFIRIELEIDKL